MRQQRCNVSILLPAFRESENLKTLLPRILQVMHGSSYAFEIIVIDSNTPLDDTETVCQKLGVTHVRRSGEGSYGDAVRAGIAAASGELSIFMDADGSHPPEIIPTLLNESKHADVVVASRYIAGGGTENNSLLTGMSLLLNGVFAFILNLPCRDVSNSFKIYKTQMLKQLNLRARDFDVIEEIIFHLSQMNSTLRIKEVPFRFRRRFSGESKRQTRYFVSFLTTLIRLRLSTRKK